MLAYLVRGTFETVVAIMQRSMLLQRSTYASIWSGYCDNLRKRPILTKAATGESRLHWILPSTLPSMLAEQDWYYSLFYD